MQQGRQRPRGTLTALALALGVALLPGPALAEDDDGPFHCDGTDPALFLEMQEAGWVGYGETWDQETCGQGATIYAAGARQWADMRPKWSLAALPEMDVQFYSTVFPVVAFGGLASIFGIAWLAAFLQRRRRVRVATLSCPSCETELQVTLDDPALRSLFCASCGAPCVVVDHGERRPRAAAAGTA